MFDKVAIIGPGLIGGSMGLALRQRGLARLVVGVGRREATLEKAVSVGAVDRGTLSVPEGVEDADLVVLATPPGSFGPLVQAALPALSPDVILTDVASTKVRVIEAMSSLLRDRPEVAYIPTHPMAGSEQMGPLAARADLFEGAVVIITPMTNTYPATKSTITHMWQAFGARTVSMTPQAHDRLVARISHLPHLAASALVAVLEDAEAELSGGGLRDTTRVASGDPDLWVDICMSNREQVRVALEQYIEMLNRAARCLRTGEMGDLRQMLADAKAKRDRTISPPEPPRA